MSLLMLKTKDLTWQDRTLNIEAMLAPTGCQLLVNKHKSYDARAATDKELYDKQKLTRLKDYVIEKRMMERRRDVINKRKKDILMERAKTADPRSKYKEMDDDVKSNISDTHLIRRKSSKRTENNRLPSHHAILQPTTSDIHNTCQEFQNGVFVTELNEHEHKLPQVVSRHPHSLSGQERDRNVKFIYNSYRMGHNHSKSKLFDKHGNPKPLHDRVKEFLREQSDFNEGPKINDWDHIDRKIKAQQKPMLANRLTSIKLDRSKLEKAFDDFCDDNSKESLQKMVKMASKLKAKVTMARNQSWVPSLAAIRLSKKMLNSFQLQKQSKMAQAQAPVIEIN